MSMSFSGFRLFPKRCLRKKTHRENYEKWYETAVCKRGNFSLPAVVSLVGDTHTRHCVCLSHWGRCVFCVSCGKGKKNDKILLSLELVSLGLIGKDAVLHC